jgi:hypothetical protein
VEQAAKAAKQTWQMLSILLLMLLLQLRIGGFCHIYNDWWLLRCAMKGLADGKPLPIL